MARARLIDGNFWIVFGVFAVLAALAWWQGGAELLQAGVGGGARLLVSLSLIIVFSFLAAGLAEVLVPRDWIGRSLGEESGVRGIVLATAAGIVTPAGPFVSLPVAAAMLRAGAGKAAVVAYITGWAVLALHRFVAWEVPILGARFALLRWAVCLALPVLAGLLTRLLLRA